MLIQHNCRTVQAESVEFVRTFCSADASPQKKMDSLRTACKRHVALTKECSAGLGSDRILYAMAQLAKDSSLGNSPQPGPMDQDKPVNKQEIGEPVLPAIFRDGGYSRLNHATLSTSNCGNPCLRLFGFGAVVPDGFGIGYIIKVRYHSCKARPETDNAIGNCRTTASLSALRASICKLKDFSTPYGHILSKCNECSSSYTAKQTRNQLPQACVSHSPYLLKWAFQLTFVRITDRTLA